MGDSSSTSLSCVRTDSGQADCLAFVVLGTVLLSTTLRIHMDRSGHIMTVRFSSILATLLSSSPLSLCNGLMCHPPFPLYQVLHLFLSPYHHPFLLSQPQHLFLSLCYPPFLLAQVDHLFLFSCHHSVQFQVSHL